MALCGAKLSLCALIISAWGIIQLSLMGICFYTQSISLLHDLPLTNDLEKAEEFYKAVDIAYEQNAYNCWIAACIYLITFLISIQQYIMNSTKKLAKCSKNACM